MASNELNNLLIVSKQTSGMNYNVFIIGMSGQEFVDKLNSNWKDTDNQLQFIDNELAIRIISTNVKEIKEENGIVSYTTDNENWKSLQATWGTILGDINSQKDLVTILADKVSQKNFEELQTIVTKNKSDILDLIANVQSLSDNINNISYILSGENGVVIRLNAVEDTLENKISSSQIKAIRTLDGMSLEFTVNNEDWLPVSQVGIVEWGNIVGDIENQADLMSKLNSIIDYSDAIRDINGRIDYLDAKLNTEVNRINNNMPVVLSTSEYNENIESDKIVNSRIYIVY